MTTTPATTPAAAATTTPAPAAPEARAVAFFVSARQAGENWTFFVSSPEHPETWAIKEFTYLFRRLGWEKFVEHIETKMNDAIMATDGWADPGPPPPREIPL